MLRPLLLLAASSLCVMASAWNDDGHRVVGFIALNELEKQKAAGDAKAETALKRTTQLLSSLPEHTTLDLASCWPDHVRPRYADHHYINVPVSRYAQLSRKWEPIAGLQGVVRAMRESQEMIRGRRKYFTNGLRPEVRESANPGEALALMAHFLGDLHMPHHVGDRSDRGGNSTYIDFEELDRSTGRKLPPERLHAFWDGVVTRNHSLSRDPAQRTTQLKEIARKLNASHPVSPARAKEADVEKWAQESYMLAWEVGYRLDLKNGRKVTEERTNNDGSKREETYTVYKANPGYKDAWRDTGYTQIVAAGYRLAEELKRTL